MFSKVKSIISTIKSELRANMNGVASKTMREAGMTADYRVNFGIELPRIELIADYVKTNIARELDIQQRMSLAQQLWKENVRECRILATMLYPAEQMLEDVADIWADDIRSVELAQISALYLFRNVTNASSLAFGWIADEREMKQIIGFYTAFHLLRNHELAERSRQEIIDQAKAVNSQNRQLAVIAGKILNLLDD